MSAYDENLLENIFFVQFLKDKELVQDAIQNKRTVCIPRQGSYDLSYQVTQEDYQNHLILRDEGNSKIFRTCGNKVLEKVPQGFQTGIGFKDSIIVKFLFEETFFLNEEEHLQVICIDRAFEGGTVISNSHELPSLNYNNLQEVSHFLFEENSTWARTQLDEVLQKCVLSHRSAGMCLKQLITNTRVTYNHCLDIVNKDFNFNRKSRQNFNITIELALECYVMSYLHTAVFSELCYIYGAKDNALNKTLRNLSQVKPQQLDDLNSVYFSSLPTARYKMGNLNTVHSPRGKIQLLCECLSAIPTADVTGRTMSMDDLLPLLNYLVIKSEIPNWLANICYMQNFTFTSHSTDDRHEFSLVCFEASLEHLRNGSLNYLIAPINQTDLGEISVYDTTHTPLQIYANCSQLNRTTDLSYILGLSISPNRDQKKRKKLLEEALEEDDPLSSVHRQADESADDNGIDSDTLSPVRDEFKRCHPLCSCEKCELGILNLRWKDINVDTPIDNCGTRALHVAAQNNYTSQIELLMSRGAHVDAVDSAERTPLHLACQRGYISSMLSLLKYKATLNAVDNLGRTPLHELCERGHTDCIQALIYRKSVLSVNAEANNGNTPLHLACKFGYGDIVSLLLDAGASMSIRNSKGETPLSIAQNKYISHLLQLFSSELEITQMKRTVKTLPNLNEEQEKLFRLVAEGDVQMIKHKLKIKEFRSSSFRRPKLRSVRQKCHPLCQCEDCEDLLSFSESSSIPASILCNSDNYTLLHIAALYGHSDLALMFSMQFTWMLDAVTKRHQLSPLHLACQYNNEYIVDILITSGCDMDSGDSQGNTPLHFTCTNGHSGCAFLLLEAKCNIALQNNRGDTALHQASRWGHIPLVNLLLRYDASPFVKNSSGLLPVHLSTFDEVTEALKRSMGSKTTQHPSEDDTIYTDCDSHISSPSPNLGASRALSASDEDHLKRKILSLDLSVDPDGTSGRTPTNVEIGEDALDAVGEETEVKNEDISTGSHDVSHDVSHDEMRAESRAGRLISGDWIIEDKPN